MDLYAQPWEYKCNRSEKKLSSLSPNKEGGNYSNNLPQAKRQRLTTARSETKNLKGPDPRMSVEEVEWDEDLCLDPEAMVIGAVRTVEKLENLPIDDPLFTVLAALPERYHKYADLFVRKWIQPLPRRQSFDHTIDLLPETTAPWGPIYSLSE